MSAASRRRKRATRTAKAIGTALLGAAAMVMMPKVFEWLGFNLNFVVDRPPHPESTEPIETKIDEHQLGRSEVVREISQGKGN